MSSGGKPGEQIQPLSSSEPLFGWLNRFDKVLVAGPGRAGTRIVSIMIAWDTDHCWVDEEFFHQNNPEEFRFLLLKHRHFVVQCPGILSTIEEYSAPDVAVIVIRRSVEAIRKSMERIGSRALTAAWVQENYPQYQTQFPENAYFHWDNFQKERVENAFEIQYEDLASHPLWVEPGKRRLNWYSRRVAGADIRLKLFLSCSWARAAV